jgi:hypothetical protein
MFTPQSSNIDISTGSMLKHAVGAGKAHFAACITCMPFTCVFLKCFSMIFNLFNPEMN